MNNDLYLYKVGRLYKVSGIKRINDKTVTMESGERLSKDDFENNTYKLSSKEVYLYKGGVMKTFYEFNNDIDILTNKIQYLINSLRYDELLCVNSEKLQELLDKTYNQLKSDFESYIKLNNEMYKIDSIQRLEKID